MPDVALIARLTPLDFTVCNQSQRAHFIGRVERIHVVVELHIANLIFRLAQQVPSYARVKRASVGRVPDGIC